MMRFFMADPFTDALRLRLSSSQREAALNSDPSGLGGSIVLLNGRTRNK